MLPSLPSQDVTTICDTDQSTPTASGPRHCPPRNSAPATCINLLFTATFQNNFVAETNKYAHAFISNAGNTLTPPSFVWKWKNVLLVEIKGFTSIILDMSIDLRPSIESYSFKSSSQCNRETGSSFYWTFFI